MQFDNNDSKYPSPEIGSYLATVETAEERISKAGNPLISLRLKLKTTAGEITVFDNLTPAYPPKIKSFCLSTGLDTAWSTGTLDAAKCEGKTCRAVFEAATGKYAIDNNIKTQIARYEALNATESLSEAAGASDDDSIPF